MALKPYDGAVTAPEQPRVNRALKPYSGDVVGASAPVEEEAPRSGLARRLVGDTAIDLGKGVLGVGEAAVGLVDIPTLGHAGKALESVGYRPDEAKEFLGDFYSPERKAANAAVEEAEGFVGTAGAMLRNPSTIAGMAVESAPLIFGGGAIARTLSGAVRSTVARAAAGEGAVGGGLAAEGIRQQTEDGLLTPGQAAIAVGSGVGTGILGAGGGAVARRLGIADPDVLAAGGVPTGAQPGVARRLASGAVTEGVFEELPQSAQEQAWENVALDRPVGEGVPEAAAAGALTGGLVGGVVATAGGRRRQLPDPANGPLSRAVNTADANGALDEAEAQAQAEAQAAAQQRPGQAGHHVDDAGFRKADEARMREAQQESEKPDIAPAAAFRTAPPPWVDPSSGEILAEPDVDTAKAWVHAELDRMEAAGEPAMNRGQWKRELNITNNLLANTVLGTVAQERKQGTRSAAPTEEAPPVDLFALDGAPERLAELVQTVMSGRRMPGAATLAETWGMPIEQTKTLRKQALAEVKRQSLPEPADGRDDTTRADVGAVRGAGQPAAVADPGEGGARGAADARAAGAAVEPGADTGAGNATAGTQPLAGATAGTAAPAVDGLTDAQLDTSAATPPAPGGQQATVPVDAAGAPAASSAAASAQAVPQGSAEQASVGPPASGEGSVQPGDGAVNAVQAAADAAATSPANGLPEPTDGQKEAGNYKKGHARIAGLDVSIENPAGSRRRPEWPPLKHHYGYIRGSVGRDKDHVDVFLTENAEDTTRPVFVVDQVDAKGKFDEHKAILGAATEDEARAAYLDNYAPGWTGLGGIRQMTQAEFKAWVRDPKATKMPASPRSPAQPTVPQGQSAPVETQVPATQRTIAEPTTVRPADRTAPRTEAAPDDQAASPVPASAQGEAATEGGIAAASAQDTPAPKAAAATHADAPYMEGPSALERLRKDKPFRAALKQVGDPHVDSEQGFRAAQGWEDAKAGRPANAENLTDVAGLTRGGDPVDSYIGAYLAAKGKAPRVVRAREAAQFYLEHGPDGARTVAPKRSAAKKPRRAAPAAVADTQPERTGNTEDAGEELWANRRNRTGKGLQWSDIESLNATLKVKEAVKTKVWPRPDYEALVEGGMPRVLAHLVKQVYDKTAAKPRTRGGATDTQLRQYVEGLAAVRDAIFDYAAKLDTEAFREAVRANDGVALARLMKEAGSPIDAVFPSEDQRRRFSGNKANNDLALLLGGRQFTRALQLGLAEIRDAARAIAEGWPAAREAWERQFAIHEAPAGSKVFRDGAHVTLDRNEFFITARRARRILADGLASREAAVEKARELAASRRGQGPSDAEKAIAVDKAVRTGAQRRAADEDVTSDTLQKTFGFRGINFGNWMKGESAAKRRERQLHLNHAYDSFADLAEILDVPARALSLDGLLGIAFGAQGHGGGAAAHFVPGVNEINLTREHGVGSLAHEWAHALDHYFAVQAGDRYAKRGEPFLTHAVHGRVDSETVRPEIVKAFSDIVQVMTKRPLTPAEVKSRRQRTDAFTSKELDQHLSRFRERIEAIGKPEERVRLLETWDQLAQRAREGDLGEGYVEGRSVRSTYRPVVAQLRGVLSDAGIRVMVDDFFRLSSTADQVAYGRRQREGERDHVPQTAPTDYYLEAGKLDAEKRRHGGRYWRMPTELLARAFQSYVLDRLATRDARNDYLTRPQMTAEQRETLLDSPLAALVEAGDRYPRGQERKEINTALDALVATMRTREGDDGRVALFSKAARDVADEAMPPAFYSALAQSVEQGRGAPRRGDAAAWKGWLDGAQRRGEFRQGERDWLGLDAWLDGRETTTRDELTEFVRANQVQVQDVVLSDESLKNISDDLNTWMGDNLNQDLLDGSPDFFDVMETLREQALEFDDEGEADLARQYRAMAEEARRLANGSTPTPPKFASYQLPGGESYRELLLTLPRIERTTPPVADDGTLENFALQPGEPTIERAPEFRSNHFSQPNVLAHVRFNERTTSQDGTSYTPPIKTLFIEEIQSDWHQQGRKRGYDTAERKAAAATKNEKQRALLDQMDTLLARGQAAGRRGHWQDTVLPADLSRYENLLDEFNAIDSATSPTGLPDAPFKATDEWAMLAFKRMVRYAAENGFDRIAWTTGAQQAERYDLSKQVDRIGYTKRPDGLYNISVEGKDRGDPVFAEDGISLDRIEEVVGKDMASKIANEEGNVYDRNNGSVTAELTGVDLKVGGEGMRAFYDSILPKAVNKWAKRFGGRVGSAKIASSSKVAKDLGSAEIEAVTAFHDISGRFWNRLSRQEQNGLTRQYLMNARGETETLSVHVLDLTPDMRAAALAGLPMFSKAGERDPGAMDRGRPSEEGLALRGSPGSGETIADPAGAGNRPADERHFSRRGWDDAFPDAVLGHRLGVVQAHPDYAAAKAGNTPAAQRLARDVVTPEYAAAVRDALPKGAKPVIVPVSALEAAGQNRIPQAAARALALQLGLTVTDRIAQASRVERGGTAGLSRLGRQPRFAGQVEKGQSYLLLDDTLTQGGTIAQLKTFIEDNGGRILLATALTGKDYSRKIALSPDTLAQLRERFSPIEGWWRDTFGYGFEGFTESEARFLLKLRGNPSPDSVRDRIAAGGLPEVGGGDGRPLRSTSAAATAGRLNAPPRAGRSASGLTFARAQQLKGELTAQWGDKAPSIVLVESAADLQRAAGLPRRVLDDPDFYRAEGLYRGEPTVWLNVGQIHSEQRLTEVLAHEALGHYGVEQVVGAEQWSAIGDTIHRHAEAGTGAADLRRAIATVKRTQPDLSRDDFTKEVIAVMAEQGARNGVIRRVIAAVRRFLRQLFPSMQWSEADIRGLLSAAETFLRRGTPTNVRQASVRAMAFSREEPSLPKVEELDDAAFLAGLTAKERRSGAMTSFASALWQSLGTSSPFFAEWFGKSKVVDDAGQPLPVYHGTAEAFDAFAKEQLTSSTGHMSAELGFFFTSKKKDAEAYAAKAAQGVPADERVIDAYLSIQNPKTLGLAELLAIDSQEQALALKTKLQAEGFDGIHLASMGWWAAFEPSQVKSTANRGTFDPRDARMLFSKAAPADIVDDITSVMDASVHEGIVARARAALADMVPKKLKDQLRPTWLGALTTRHLTELGGDYFDNMRHYTDYLAEMGADRNQLQQEGEDIAERARKWASKNRAEARQLFDLMHDATVDGVDPAEEFQPLKFKFGSQTREATKENIAEAVEGLKEQMRGRSGDSKVDMMARLKTLRGMPARDRRRRQQYPGLVDRWNALGADAQAVYREFRDTYAARSEAVEKALVERIRDTDAPENQKQKLINMIRLQFEAQRLEGVYFPLQRHGRFFVAAEKAAGKDVVPTFLMFERVSELEAAVKDLRARGFTITAQGLKSAGKAQDAPSGTFVADVIQQLKKAGVSDKTQDEIYQIYLQTLPEMSMRKHSIHRKTVPGWDPDAVRAFAWNMHHGAHQLARLRYAHKLQAVLELLKLQQNKARKEEGADTRKITAGDAVLQELERRHEWIMNPQDSQATNLVSSFGFSYYLGLTPAAALVNLSQTALVSYPYLAARHGPIKAMNALLAGARDSGRTLGNIQRVLTDPEDLAAHAALMRSGALDKTQAHNLAGIAEGGLIGYNPKWAKTMEIVGFAFHKAEVINREATGLAAFRLARAEGKPFAEAVKFASDAIYDTHFDYCVDTETEALTLSGWKRHDQIKPGDVLIAIDEHGRAVESVARAINVFPGPKQVIEFSSSRRFSMAVTPHHEVVIQRHDSRRGWGPVSKVQARDIKGAHHVLRAPLAPLVGRSPQLGRDLSALLGWIAAEGWYAKFRNCSEKRDVRLSQSITHNPAYVEEIRGILSRIGTVYSEQKPAANGTITWTIGGDLRKRILALMPEKLLTFDMLGTMTAEEMAATLEAFCKGDGSRRGTDAWTIGQGDHNRQNLHVLQAMATVIGRTATLSDGGPLILTGGRRPTQRTIAKGLARDTIEVDTVWCPTTEHGTWVARRRGAVFVTGNSNANRARFMQSGTAKVLLMFRQYSLNMTWHLARMLWQATKNADPEVKRLARRNLAGVLGMTSLFAGVLGLPLMSVTMGVLNAVAASAGDDDEPWEAETEFKAFLVDMLGPAAAGVLLRGPVNAATGADIATRVSLSELWFRDADRELEGRGLYYHLLEQAAGPMGGVLKNALVGKQMIDEGHLWRGVEATLPKAMKDVLKAGRYSTEGVNTLRGDPLIEDLGVWQTLMQLNGFTPAQVADRYDRNRALKNYEQHIRDRREHLLNAFAMANRLGDEDGRRSAMAAMHKFNRSHPEVAITPATVRLSLRGRARYSQKAEAGIVLHPRLAAKVRAAVGEGQDQDDE